MSLKILMVFGNFLLFSIFSLFPDFKKIFFCFVLIFMSNAFFKNLLILCCLSTFQNRGLELMWSSLTAVGQWLPGCAIRGWGWSWAFSWGDSPFTLGYLLVNSEFCFLREYCLTSCLGICIYLVVGIWSLWLEGGDGEWGGVKVSLLCRQTSFIFFP